MVWFSWRFLFTILCLATSLASASSSTISFPSSSGATTEAEEVEGALEGCRGGCWGDCWGGSSFFLLVVIGCCWLLVVVGVAVVVVVVVEWMSVATLESDLAVADAEWILLPEESYRESERGRGVRGRGERERRDGGVVRESVWDRRNERERGVREREWERELSILWKLQNVRLSFTKMQRKTCK